MFSLVSLYFAYRRDVVMAERHIPALAQDPVSDVAEQAGDIEISAEQRELPLAA